MAIVRREENQGMTRGRQEPRWDPFETMREMLNWGGLGLAEPLRLLTGREGFVPTFDVKETKDAYLFKADLPGVKQDDVEISLTGNRLTISGKREAEKRDEGERYFAFEREYGAFSRSFTLPDGVDTEHVSAEMKDGVLAVMLPKKPEVQPKKIALKIGEEKKAKA